MKAVQQNMTWASGPLVARHRRMSYQPRSEVQRGRGFRSAPPWQIFISGVLHILQKVGPSTQGAPCCKKNRKTPASMEAGSDEIIQNLLYTYSSLAPQRCSSRPSLNEKTRKSFRCSIFKVSIRFFWIIISQKKYFT